ncbi:High mobility group box domain containing protein [Parasponia andersonii]|uniref:High mobility group box domain containing protein n=1 Tax=Parasponia andersonii TaxID=3476 RepID=A0A2P5AFR5_PARAD|nr:High mobility group box domain containing protein [Parasponia andersonii]
MPPKGSHCGKSREVPPKRATPWNNFFKSYYTSFRNQNLGKEEAEIRKEFALLYSKLTEAEKANYADIVHGTEICYAKSGELQGESEADNDKARELKSRCSFDCLSRIGNVLTEDQKEAVRQVGFGTFLRQNSALL